MENYIEKLDQLIALKKNKGHKITKAESEEFVSAWQELIAADKAYTPRAEQYLYDGVIFSAAKAFAGWVVAAEDKPGALDCLFKGQLFGKETLSTFRVLVSTLAYLINAGVEEKNLVCPVMKHIPSASRNKEKKLIGDGHRIVLNYFISEIDDPAKLPALSELEAEPAVITSFTDVFSDFCNRINDSSLSKKDKVKVLSVRKWLHPETETPATEQKDGEDRPKENVDKQSKQEEVQTGDKPLTPEMTDPFEQLTKVLDTAYSLVDQIRKGTEEHNTSNLDTIKTLRGEIDSHLRQNEITMQQITALNKQLAERSDVILKLNTELEDLEKKKTELSLEVTSKEEEIQQRRQMIEALSRDRAKQSDVLVNRLASRLKVEYRDFKDAESLPMDPDLGENMREQLKNIFSILSEAGIPLE